MAKSAYLCILVVLLSLLSTIFAIGMGCAADTDCPHPKFQKCVHVQLKQPGKELTRCLSKRWADMAVHLVQSKTNTDGESQANTLEMSDSELPEMEEEEFERVLGLPLESVETLFLSRPFPREASVNVLQTHARQSIGEEDEEEEMEEDDDEEEEEFFM